MKPSNELIEPWSDRIVGILSGCKESQFYLPIRSMDVDPTTISVWIHGLFEEQVEASRSEWHRKEEQLGNSAPAKIAIFFWL